MEGIYSSKEIFFLHHFLLILKTDILKRKFDAQAVAEYFQQKSELAKADYSGKPEKYGQLNADIRKADRELSLSDSLEELAATAQAWGVTIPENDIDAAKITAQKLTDDFFNNLNR